MAFQYPSPLEISLSNHISTTYILLSKTSHLKILHKFVYKTKILCKLHIALENYLDINGFSNN